MGQANRTLDIHSYELKARQAREQLRKSSLSVSRFAPGVARVARRTAQGVHTAPHGQRRGADGNPVSSTVAELAPQRQQDGHEQLVLAPPRRRLDLDERVEIDHADAQRPVFQEHALPEQLVVAPTSVQRPKRV